MNLTSFSYTLSLNKDQHQPYQTNFIFKQCNFYVSGPKSVLLTHPPQIYMLIWHQNFNFFIKIYLYDELHSLARYEKVN